MTNEKFPHTCKELARTFGICITYNSENLGMVGLVVQSIVYRWDVYRKQQKIYSISNTYHQISFIIDYSILKFQKIYTKTK